jgi:outer membrane protein assembly factor BamD
MTFFPSSVKGISRLLPCAVILAILLSTSGCGTNFSQYYFGDLFGKKKGSPTEKNADQLALDGMTNMQKKDYDAARKNFQALKEHYPYSKFAPLAELKLGDARYYNREYSEAAMAYEEFARLHPRNEVIPYVVYQIGMCHFLLFSTTDRDQEETRAAMESFQKLIQAFPNSDYATRGKKQLFECQKRIVAHEYNVGEFYYRLKEYQSTKDRLEKIAKDYPRAVQELGYEESVRKMLAGCEKNLAKGPKKPSVWTKWGF